MSKWIGAFVACQAIWVAFFIHSTSGPSQVDESGFRDEKDTMGTLKVPAARYWGAQTQRSIQNFEIDMTESSMPRPLISALGVVKRAAAVASRKALEKIDKRIPDAIV